MEICEVEKCTGCQACLNACPVSAISMCADSRGFLRPNIDVSTCISCNKCQRVCPQKSEQLLNPVLDVYAAYSISDEVRISSSSGGMFTMLAEQCIASGGVVFGAVYDQNLRVHHVAVEKKEDLACLRGSKYVQSDIGNTLTQAKNILEQGRNVLFSGTPCQIAGLKLFLSKEYPALITVDILCHGVPSPDVFSKHISSLSHSTNAAIVDYRFRSKPLGWKDYKTQIVTFDKQTMTLDNDPFMDGFLRNIYLRESCYHCSYAKSCRAGDITLGDYWSYSEQPPQYFIDDNRGMSLVLVNTEKGQRAFNAVRNSIMYSRRSLDDAKRGNPTLTKPSKKADNADTFWDCYKVFSWVQLCEQFQFSAPKQMALIPNAQEKHLPYLIRQVKHTVASWIRRIVRRLRRDIN